MNVYIIVIGVTCSMFGACCTMLPNGDTGNKSNIIIYELIIPYQIFL